MTELSKVFDCIPYNLLINKLKAYGLGEKALTYICSYLTNRSQCACIVIPKNGLQKIISDVVQEFITGPIFFYFLMNDLFFFISNISMYSYADDNTFSVSPKVVMNLRNILQSESESLISLFRNNKMILNLNKFRAIVLNKRKKLSFKSIYYI